MTFITPLHGEANDPRGRALIDPEIFKLPRTRVLVTTGQSMLANFSDASPTVFDPASPAYELCVFDGGVRQCDGLPMMNMNSWPHFPADQFSCRVSVLDEWGRALVGLGKNARTLICGLNIGGTCSWQWVPGTPLFDKAMAALDLIQSMGLEITEWVHCLGHGDRQDAEASGRPVTETSARMAAYTSLFFKGLRSAGYNGKVIMGLGSYQAWCTEAQRAAIIAGQKWAALANGVIVGPNDDNLSAAVYRAVADGCHWSESGRWAMTYNVHPDPAWAWMNYFSTL